MQETSDLWKNQVAERKWHLILHQFSLDFG